MAIGLSSIALIGASAALAAVIFKNKEPRVKEVIDLAQFTPEEIDASPQLKIVKNDLNAYLTGIQDVQFHEILVDIIDKYNKPVGYFSRLEGRLTLDLPYYIEIKKNKKWYGDFVGKENLLSYFVHFMVFISLIFLAINYENHRNNWVKSASLGFSATAGVVLYYWFSSIEFKHKRYTSPKELKEYEDIFRDYAKKKQSDNIIVKDNTLDK
ncbi:hypothetical protein ABRZ24_11270 [Brenneria populi]|uniref:Uncharacterized protein n=1 Tax=Brenneria populi TaxID=1505588 RepID=A0ABU6JRB0_9GAMM|nr:hypothetical protein [Brenneria populi Li et al. 2015]